MIILHPWVPGVRPADQAHAWESLGAVSERGGPYRVEHLEVHPDDWYAYASAIVDLWGRDDLLTWEHDVGATPEALDRLWACPRPICTVLPMAHSEPVEACWLGWTKVARRLQEQVRYPVPPRTHWAWIDVSLTTTLSRTAGEPWHVHDEPSVTHYHGPPI